MLIELLNELKIRNASLYYFGLVCLLASIIFLILTRVSTTQVFQVNAWYKPFKFAFSTFLFSWSMAWFCHYLIGFNAIYFSISTILLLGFEIVYIAIQAGRGQLSHYNLSSPFYTAMYSMMAIAASVVTLYTAYICYLFFTSPIAPIPHYYLWAIRLSLILFVVFSFEGFVMGSRLNHSVGGVNENSSLFIVGWSKTVGDLRVAHFVGMHALQLLPLISFYVLKNTKSTFAVAILYGLLAVSTFRQAMRGKPLIKSSIGTKMEVN